MSDIEILTRLNAGYLAADQNCNVEWYRGVLAPDFTASLPDLLIRDKEEFLELISKPRPFTELTAYDVRIRVLGDFALVHARITYRTLDGVVHEGRYTDDYQRRDGEWRCIAANVIAKGI